MPIGTIGPDSPDWTTGQANSQFLWRGIAEAHGADGESVAIPCGNWSSIYLNFQSAAATDARITISFYADSAKTLALSSAVYVVVNGTSVYADIPVIGPYVTFTVVNTPGGSNLCTVILLGRNGVVMPGQIANNSIDVLDANRSQGTGVSGTITPTAYQPGDYVLNVSTSTNNFTVDVQFYTQAGGWARYAKSPTPTNSQISVLFTCPANPWRIVIFNFDPGTLVLNSSILRRKA